MTVMPERPTSGQWHDDASSLQRDLDHALRTLASLNGQLAGDPDLAAGSRALVTLIELELQRLRVLVDRGEALPPPRGAS